jgi:hypothetical protein
VTEISIRISEWYSNEDEKIFYGLWFYNTNITSFEENAFYDISFTYINIDEARIERIHENAFNSSRLTLKSLSMWVSSGESFFKLWEDCNLMSGSFKIRAK